MDGLRAGVNSPAARTPLQLRVVGLQPGLQGSCDDHVGGGKQLRSIEDQRQLGASPGGKVFALQAVLQRMRMLATGQQDAFAAHTRTDLERPFEGLGAVQVQLTAIGQRLWRASIPSGLPIMGKRRQLRGQEIGMIAPLLDGMIVPAHPRLAIVAGWQQLVQRLLQHRGRKWGGPMADHPGTEHARGAAR